MCDPKPGTRCASDSRTQAECNAEVYVDRFPDGPPVDSMTNASAQMDLLARRVSHWDMDDFLDQQRMEQGHTTGSPYPKGSALDGHPRPWAPQQRRRLRAALARAFAVDR